MPRNGGVGPVSKALLGVIGPNLPWATSANWLSIALVIALVIASVSS